ncbi:rhomboid family intramembrane serine protease [Sulfurisphaera javensis]|uniref:Rhomboid family intramembrane serine protease n=1 Tax=Sulfurisphaera javensis TaxID=2049879 RepID=A0AAT9GR64_9CREN
MKSTVVLIISITIGYIIGQILSLQSSFLLYYLIQINYLILKYGFYWQLLTSIFITPSFFDWAFNAIALYFIYWLYKSQAGKLEYLVFLLSGIVGNLFSLFLYSPLTASAGASGGIFGLFAYYAVSDYLKDKQVNKIAIILLLAVFIMSDTLPFFDVDIWAHTGGILTGVLLSLLLFKIYETRRTV